MSNIYFKTSTGYHPLTEANLSNLVYDITSSRGSFYTVKPTADYLPDNYKHTINSYVKANPIFHYNSLLDVIKQLDSSNCPSHEVIAAYLKKINFNKRKVKIPGSLITVWSNDSVK